MKYIKIFTITTLAMFLLSCGLTPKQTTKEIIKRPEIVINSTNIEKMKAYIIENPPFLGGSYYSPDAAGIKSNSIELITDKGFNTQLRGIRMCGNSIINMWNTILISFSKSGEFTRVNIANMYNHYSSCKKISSESSFFALFSNFWQGYLSDLKSYIEYTE